MPSLLVSDIDFVEHSLTKKKTWRSFELDVIVVKHLLSIVYF